MFSFALLLIAASNVIAADLVSVRARQTTASTGTRYAYAVTNDADKVIVTILIGVDWNKHDPTLSSEPVGWDPLRSRRVGFGWSIPAASASAPVSWIPMAVLFEERSFMAIGWTVTDKSAPGVGPKASLAGFEVIVDRPDSAYREGPFTAMFADGTTSGGRISK